MTTVTVSPPKGSENNPLGQEVVKLVSEQLIKVRHNDLKTKLEKINCQQHPDILTNISLTIDGDNVIPFIDPCCSSFFETLKIAISEINNI